MANRSPDRRRDTRGDDGILRSRRDLIDHGQLKSFRSDRDSRERDSQISYEVRRSRPPKSPRRDSRSREYRRSYEVRRSRPQKSPRRDSREREYRTPYEERRCRSPTSTRIDPRERDSRRSYVVQRSRSPWSARKERESRKGDNRRPYQSPRSRSIEPNTPQKPIQILGLGGRMPKSWELVLIKMPFEDIMGSLSVSAGKKVKTPNFHPILIVNYLESPGKESRVKLTGFIVRSFSHHSDPVQWIDGKCQDEKDIVLPMPSKYPVFDFRGANFDDYDEEDYADDRSEPEPPPLPLFKKLKNDEIRQKVEEWGKKVLP